MSHANLDLTLRWQDQNVVKKDGKWTVDGRPTPGVSLAFHHKPSNLPDVSWIGLLVTAPPNAATPPHSHGGAAVTATVIRGHVLNQMVHTHVDSVTGETRTHDSGAKIYAPGETWYEAPGCHHVRSETVGDEEVVFIANLVVSDTVFEGIDPNDQGMEATYARMGRVVVIDKDVEEQQSAARI